jgi:ribosomal protein L10
MSKYVKNLVARDISQRLDGVQDALLVNVVGMTANQTVVLRRQLREKNIHLLVVKNGLAKRATEGTPLAPAFEGAEGALALVWGAEDFISLVKEVTRLDQGTEFAKFQARGGVMDGERLTPDKVKEISKWPGRQQQLSILLGQILSPGASLLSQITAPGGALASQIKQKSEGEDGETPAPDASLPPAGEAPPEASAASEGTA